MEDIKKGAFHAWLGKPESEPITQADIDKGLASDDEHVRKMAQFAKNEEHWQHESVQPSFIEHVFTKDYTKAEDVFRKVMAEKMSAALGARRIELAQTLYSRVQGAE
jgi:hypothetical protein